jgi:glycine hydroxymethyltransferase
MSRTVPWADEPARSRLASVEAALPADALAALGLAAASAREHARAIEEECLLLYAGGNVPSPLVAGLHEAALMSQPSMGYPGDKYQPGLERIDVVEVAASEAVGSVMRARFAEVRPTSATLANLAVYTALTSPGDTIAVLPDWAGGHLSHHAVGAPGVHGLRVVELPYDDERLDVDLAALPGFLERERPALVVVGASLMLFPHRLTEIAALVRVPLLYDASHVAGLIAEGRFQAPLAEGADLMTFSTYKSFGGPPGGAIVTNDEALAARVATAVYPGLVANYDAARLVPLAAAALERSSFGGAYADACIANAQALAAALADAGLPVLGAERGFTASHHVALDARRFGDGKAAALALARSGLLLSEIGIPRDPAGGLRIGTQSITRQGFVPGDMPAIAAAFAGVLIRGQDVREAVAAVRKRHRGLQWCLSPADLP